VRKAQLTLPVRPDQALPGMEYTWGAGSAAGGGPSFGARVGGVSFSDRRAQISGTNVKDI